ESEPAGPLSSATTESAPATPRAPSASAVPTEMAAEADITAVADNDGTAPIAVPEAEQQVASAAVGEPLDASAPLASDGNTQFWVAALAGLGAVALAIWGFVAIGRRRPVDRKAAVAIERAAGTRPKAAEPTAAAEPPAEVPNVTPLSTARVQSAKAAPSLAHTGASVPLPLRVPDTFAERDELLQRMIAAKPDRANPFTTRGARLKRARLILQSLGQDFDGREPWIDLSQYPSNWPNLAGRKHAAA